VTPQKPPWQRRNVREAQNPYALIGSGVNYSYPGQADLGLARIEYFSHQQLPSPRRTPLMLGRPHERMPQQSGANPVRVAHSTRGRLRAKSANAVDMLKRKEQARLRRADAETRAHVAAAVEMNPERTSGYWRPRSAHSHRERTWGWQR
jgi:hypothetical protein